MCGYGKFRESILQKIKNFFYTVRLRCNFRKEDLIVGAPFYHRSGAGGAIYVFLNGPSVGFSILIKFFPE